MGYHDRNGAADLAQSNAEFADAELRKLLKRFSFETAERFHDEIEKIGVRPDDSLVALSSFIEEILGEAVHWPDVERAREDALAAE